MIFFTAAKQGQFKLPTGLPPPTGLKLIYFLQGVGTQNYKCVKNSDKADSNPAWVLYAVSARLTEKKTATSTQSQGAVSGLHFLTHEKGSEVLTPVWKVDGKRIFGKKRATLAQGAKNIPCLELDAAGGSNVKRIYRTETKGGVAPNTEVCNVGKTIKIPYSATYSFWG